MSVMGKFICAHMHAGGRGHLHWFNPELTKVTPDPKKLNTVYSQIDRKNLKFCYNISLCMKFCYNISLCTSWHSLLLLLLGTPWRKNAMRVCNTCQLQILRELQTNYSQGKELKIKLLGSIHINFRHQCPSLAVEQDTNMECTAKEYSHMSADN